MTKIKCKHCGDVIESDGRGKFVQCSCGKIYIDETQYYCRVGGNLGDFEIIKENKDDNNKNTEKQQCNIEN